MGAQRLACAPVASPTKKLSKNAPTTPRETDDAPDGAAGGESGDPRADAKRLPAHLGAPLAIVVGAVLLRIISGVGFANYDTLYALVVGAAADARRNPAVRDPDRANAPPACRGARRGGRPARTPRHLTDSRRARLPRALRLRVGRVPVGLAVVQPPRRRRRGAAAAHARADPLLRGARLRGHPLPAAGAVRTDRRDPAPPRGSARAGAAGARRAAAARGVGVLGPVLAVSGAAKRRAPPASSPASRCWPPPPRSRGWRATGW